MKTKLFILAIALFSALHVFSQLEQIFVETIEHDGIEIPSLEGQTTYRVFAQLTDSTDWVRSFYGNDICPLSVNTSTAFYRHNAHGGILLSDISSYLLAFPGFEELPYSSGVTIGSIDDENLGVPFSVNESGFIPDTIDATSGILQDPENPWFSSLASGQDFNINTSIDYSILGIPLEAGVYTLNSNLNQTHGPQNSVLLGQFTTDGVFSFNLNLKVFSIENGEEIEYIHSWCDGEILSLSYISGDCTSAVACNYNVEALEDDGSCVFPGDVCNDQNINTALEVYQDDCTCGGGVPAGCTDPEACNYNELVEIDNGTCNYTGLACNDSNFQTINDAYSEECECVGELLGCTDANACNWNELAEIDDESCLFPGDYCNSVFNSNFNALCECENNISGIAFIDDNFDGELDLNEVPLPYQTIELEPLGLVAITNDQGEFSFSNIPEGVYDISITFIDEWTSYTTDQIQIANVPQSINNSINFGVSNSDIPDPSACIDFYQWGNGMPCNGSLNYNVCYRNMSPYPISGVIEIQLDDLLSINYSNPTADSIVGQSVFWSFTNQAPYFLNMDDIVVNTPDETHIGEFVQSTAIVYAWVDGVLEQITENSIYQEVTCAYDPNDITGIPNGYTDEHWVLEDQRMEYVIRFQNTGNAPAETVLVVDTLDADMDINTFQLIANSHSVMTTVEPSGRVEFLFENINLPDSTANEPESHGLVSFKVDFIDDISIGEEVNQTAYIFFDNNPPIITNTTWHTIHECGGEAAFETGITEICTGETVEFTSTYPHLEDYLWSINNESEGFDPSLSRTFSEAGTYDVQFTGENPLCAESSSETITVYANPTVTISQNGDLLSSSEGDSYQWFLNGELIDGATDQEYSVTEDGTYTVEVTNGGLCTGTSEGVMVVSISELEKETILLYPNPMTDRAFLEFEDASVRTVRLIDSTGKEVKVWNSVATQKIEITKNALAAGSYLLTIDSRNKLSSFQLIIR